MNHRLTLLIVVLTFTGLSHLPLAAQSAGAARANQEAYALYNAGSYAEAAQAYEKLIRDYPTDAIVTLANVQLGFSYYFNSNFDKAQAVVEKTLKDPALPPELKPIAASFLPQVISSKAAALALDSPERKPTFEKAIKEYTNFVTQFATAPQIESIIYGRALANYQIANYDETVKDLESNLQKFANSPTILDSQNLLALTLATQASLEITKGDTADRTKAFALFHRSTSLLDDIIKKKTDLTMVNDAQFQLGEILFNMAAFSPENERAPLYEKAMEAYRQVAPNEQMIDLQKEKIATFPERRRQLVLKRATPAQHATLDGLLEREQRKLAELEARPDQVATAMLKMGEIYFNRSTQEKSQYNEARVVLNQVQPFLQNDNDRKRALYFLTMTYALQNVEAKATQRYDEFQTKHKGDELAQNLPIAMGNMYLSLSTPDPEKAISYFDQSLEIYGKGPLVNLTIVSKARAQVQLKQFEEAEKTFINFLASNPSPDIAVGAQMGLADIYKSTKQWDKALTAYQAVVTQFPDKPQRTDAEYWIAVVTKEKGDNAGAVPLLQKFIAAHPDYSMIPTMLYALAEAQVSSGATDGAIASLTELATKFPDSLAAPFSYFMRAKIYSDQKNVEETNKMLRALMEKYPKHEKIFFAYDTIARNSLAASDIPGAVKVYAEFIEKYPDAPQAPASLLEISNLTRNKAESMGRYGALNTDEQTVWKGLIENSASANEQLVAKYPDSAELAPALGALLKNQRLLLAAGLKNPSELQTYLEGLSQNAASDSAKSKIQFTLANYEAEKSKDSALNRMNTAFQESVVYSPTDMDFYGQMLIDKKEFDKAKKVFEKLAANYPLPPDVPMAQVPRALQEAQAVSLFGLGKIAQESGQSGEAATLFQQLKSQYPWSPKALEADYGIAENEVKVGKLDEALGKLPGIIRNPNATAELRAKAMFQVGLVYQKKSEAANDPKQKADFLGAAVDNVAKINQLYPNTSVSAESLWLGGQLFEAQVAASTDAAFKQKQTRQAGFCYKDIVRDYPNSSYAEKAQERLTALGVK